MKNITKNKKLLEDVESIYLGNLGTIDTDMDLPKIGNNGTHFKWESDEHLFLSDDGRVTRPTPGVGNRLIHLTLTATLNDDSMSKVYGVTVIQQTRRVKIDHPLNLNITVQNNDFQLPKVTVVELENGEYSTSEVEWSGQFNQKLEKQTIKGYLKENNAPIKITINFKLQKSRKVKNNFKDFPVSILGESVYSTAYRSMLDHLSKVDLDKLLYNFRVAAKLDVDESKRMTGWDAPDCNLRGHTTGHYMSAMAFAYFDSGNEIYKDKLDYMVSELSKCQQQMAKNGSGIGFLSAYDESQFDKLENFETYPNIWAPYYTLDKILTGLLDSYLYTNNLQALEIAKKIGNWTHGRLSKLTYQQLTKMWSIYIAGEFGGMISAMIRLYRYTNKQIYLDTAKLFNNDKLFLPMQLGFDTLNNMHANQHIPQIIGAMDLYEETGYEKYLEIGENFWNMVVKHHSFANGGVGETEMFHEPDEVAEYLTDKSEETCASYNMFKLSRQLFNFTHDSKYFDYAENILNNHLLVANDHLDDGGSTYFLPLRAGGKKKYDTDVDNTCCHGSGLETVVRFQKDIFAFDYQGVYVNLFYDSKMVIPEYGSIQQQITDNQVTIKADFDKEVKLYVRIPNWMENIRVKINNLKDENYEMQNGYALFGVSSGEVNITISFDKQFVIKPATDNQNLVSVFYGIDMLAQQSSSDSCANQDLKFNDLIPFNTIEDSNYTVYFKRSQFNK